MTHADLTTFFLALGLLLLTARVLGEIAKRFGQPAVLGEILAGIILGPTVLGELLPNIQLSLFPTTDGFRFAMQGVTSFAITLFLLVAGMEVDLSSVIRQGRSSAIISFWGMVVPFGVGFGGAWFLPNLMGAHEGADRLIFALFVGTALAISALPVIAKTLLDLDLYRSEFGMVVISVAVVDDLVGWLLFAVILGMMGGSDDGFTVPQAIMLTLGFAFLLLTVGRVIIDRLLPRVQAYTSWPGGVLGFAIVGALLCGAFTEWIGIHSIFGAFLFGVALGDSSHLREKTRQILDHFISYVFAPLFFASVGLKVNFAANFDLALVLVVLVVACAGKLIGAGWASRLAGFSKRESLAIGFGMNARGAMEIILALTALQVGLIDERMFVAIVVMALVTSMMAGTAMERLLQRQKVKHFFDFLPARGYVGYVKAETPEEMIVELCDAAAEAANLPKEKVREVVLQRERIMSTGMGNGLAIPHGRIPGLSVPLVAIGFSRDGIDFDAPDGEVARVVLLVLTPQEDYQSQLDLLADISRSFRVQGFTERILRTTNHVELLALMRSDAAPAPAAAH